MKRCVDALARPAMRGSALFVLQELTARDDASRLPVAKTGAARLVRIAAGDDPDVALRAAYVLMNCAVSRAAVPLVTRAGLKDLVHLSNETDGDPLVRTAASAVLANLSRHAGAKHRMHIYSLNEREHPPELRAEKPNDAPAPVATKPDAVQRGLRDAYPLLCDAFDYYAARGPHGDIFTLGMESWTHFCRDCGLSDGDDDAEAEDVHVQCCIEATPAVTNERHGKHKLTRHQFLEAYVRMVDFKFGLGSIAEDHIRNCRLPSHKYVAEAFAKVLGDMKVRLPRGAILDGDAFRRSTLYKADVDDALSRHKKRLAELFEAYAARRGVAGGLHFGVETWEEFVEDAGLRCAEVSRLDVHEVFLRSKMRSIDDLAEKHRALTFVDFLEALCRVFLLFPVPSAAALDEMRSRQITEFFVGIAKLVDAGAMGDQRVFDLLAPDLDARLADKVPRMVPYVFQCLAVTHRGRLATHGRHVSFKKDLTPAQENRWFNSRAPYTAERVGQLVEALEKPARHRLDALVTEVVKHRYRDAAAQILEKVSAMPRNAYGLIAGKTLRAALGGSAHKAFLPFAALWFPGKDSFTLEDMTLATSLYGRWALACRAIQRFVRRVAYGRLIEEARRESLRKVRHKTVAVRRRRSSVKQQQGRGGASTVERPASLHHRRSSQGAVTQQDLALLVAKHKVARSHHVAKGAPLAGVRPGLGTPAPSGRGVAQAPAPAFGDDPASPAGSGDEAPPSPLRAVVRAPPPRPRPPPGHPS